jgi:hypothetical protein
MSIQDHDDPAAESTAGDPLSFDTSVAHPARIYNYRWREGTMRLTARPPSRLSRVNTSPGRARHPGLLRRAVEFVAGQGIRHADAGTGPPTADNTHEVAQGIVPSRGSSTRTTTGRHHARALLTSTPEGATAYVDATRPDTAKIIESAAYR